MLVSEENLSTSYVWLGGTEARVHIHNNLCLDLAKGLTQPQK